MGPKTASGSMLTTMWPVSRHYASARQKKKGGHVVERGPVPCSMLERGPSLTEKVRPSGNRLPKLLARHHVLCAVPGPRALQAELGDKVGSQGPDDGHAEPGP